tara:strand:- start:174 stop:800 length:627 start_codon:yes stop_codon:yes gene_type:complete
MNKKLTGIAALLAKRVQIPTPEPEETEPGPTQAIARATKLTNQIAKLQEDLDKQRDVIKKAAIAVAGSRVTHGHNDGGTRVLFDGCHVDVKPPLNLSLGSITDDDLRAAMSANGDDFATFFKIVHTVKPKSSKVSVSRDWAVATIGEDAVKLLEQRITFVSRVRAVSAVNNVRASLAKETDPATKELLSALFDDKPSVAIGGFEKEGK